MTTIDLIILFLSIIAGIIFLKLFLDSVFGWYLRARFNGERFTLGELRSFKRESLPLISLIDSYHLLRSNNILVTLNEIIEKYQLGVDISNVKFGLIEAQSLNLALSFTSACIADSQDIDICATIEKYNTVNVEKEKI